ncbi:coat protein [Rice Noda-like virus]|nr:coat protein [Rice Noda-like virus]
MAGEKNLVCSACSRKYASKKALAQHKRDAHTVKSVKPKTSQPKVVGAPYSASTRSMGAVDNSVLTLSGTDRLSHVSSISKFKHGEVITDLLVTVDDFVRLKQLASAFQRIKWLFLEFEIVPKVSTATSGGFVAAFVRDPGDGTIKPGETSLAWLQSQSSATTGKWWETRVVRATLPRDLLFTSPSVEVREYSPGRFIVLADGAASQDGDVTISVRYKVQLSQVGETTPQTTSDTTRTYTVTKDLITQQSHTGLFYKVGNDYKSDTASMFDPDPPYGSVLRAPFTMTFADNGSRVDSARYLFVKGANDVYFCHGPTPDRKYADISGSETDILSSGDVLQEVYTPASLNLQEGSSLKSNVEPSLTVSLTSLRELTDQMSTLNRLLSSLNVCQPDRAQSPFEEISKSMVSHRSSSPSGQH